VSEVVTGLERDIVVACLASDDPAPYNIPVFLRFDEQVDLDRLADAAQALLNQPELLRRRYFRQGHDILRGMTAPALVERVRCRVADLPRLARERRLQVLDAPLVKVVVIEVVDDPHDRLFVNVHHVLMDGMSLTIFLHAVVEAYLSGQPEMLDCAGGRATLPEQPYRPVHRPGSVPLPTVPVTDELVTGFLEAFDRRRRPGANVVHRRSINLPEADLSFAANLTAFVPALAEWCGTPRVVLSIALLGRPVSQLRELGNFVRLEPLAFDVRQWQDVTAVDLRRSMAALAADLVVRSGHHGTVTPAGRSRLTEVMVVFDYKSETLVPERIHPGLTAFLEEESTYWESKFEVHFSIYKTGCVQSVTVSARDLPEHAVIGLADAYERRLRQSSSVGQVSPTHQRSTMEATTSVRS